MQKLTLRQGPFTALVLSFLTAAVPFMAQAQISLQMPRILPALELDLESDELEFRNRELLARQNKQNQNIDPEDNSRMVRLSEALILNAQSKETWLSPLRQSNTSFEAISLPGYKLKTRSMAVKKLWSHEESLVINHLESFRLDTAAPRVFSMPLHNANYQLKIENRLPLTQTNDPQSNSQQEPPLDARLNCDKDIQMEIRPGFGSKSGRQFKFQVWNSRVNGQKIRLKFPDPQTRCSLAFRTTEPADKIVYGVQLYPESDLYPKLENLQTSAEVCTVSQTTGKDPSSIFFGAPIRNIGCPQPTGGVQMLADPYTAFNERMKALTGSDIPRTVFENQDLSYQIDFSKSPRLDLVIVSTLQFKSDFVGTMLARALAFHARQGAMVRVMSTKILLGDKDERLIAKLVAEGRGNVKYHPFAYDQEGPLNTGIIDKLHRTNHMKIVLGFSASQPQNNFVIVGGRNIRDSYYFRKIPDYSKNPELVQYQAKEEMFIHYVDLEVLVRSTDLVRQVAMQFLSFLNRDSASMRPERSSYHLPVLSPERTRELFQVARESRGWARHFMSIPYADGAEMETLYVRMIDSATKHIRLISPYFAPRAALLEALNRAVERGVKVQIITRINLAGDDIPKITEDVNRTTINKTFRKLEVYEWMEPDSILHTKALMIDENLLYIGGTNINNRSFEHDLESGFIFTGRDLLGNFQSLYDGHYMKKSRRVVEPGSIGLLNKVLIWMGKSYF